MAAAKAPEVKSSRNGWQKQVLCRFFANGSCRVGDNCPYGHNLSLSNKGTIACKYFSTGTCANGDKCRFRHDVAQQRPAVSQKKASLNPNAAPWSPPPSWSEAPEFVPKSSQPLPEKEEETANDQQPKTWSQVVNPNPPAIVTIEEAESQLCPFFLMGECRYGENCAYLHGDTCDLCSQPSLHPEHEGQRRHHRKSCLEQHEADMELAFAVAKSKDRTCGICMEVVLDKAKSEARFGIMPNCNHCYCLSCLRKWRQAKMFENKIIRACPECRQTSNYICPSRFWVDTPEEKAKLLTEYRSNLHKKECKYFNKGQGDCPFGNKCFYRHVSSTGEEVDVGPPHEQFRQRKLLYDYVISRDFLDIDNVMFDILSDSDDSEFGVYYTMPNGNNGGVYSSISDFLSNEAADNDDA